MLERSYHIPIPSGEDDDKSVKIVITEFMGSLGLKRLEQSAQVIYDPELWQRDHFPEEYKNASALIVRNKTLVSDELLNQFMHVKVIGRLGVGLDNIDLFAAKKRGIAVVVAKNANAVAVAEYVFAAMLTTCRQLQNATQHVCNGGWDRLAYGGTELFGKVLGLIGAGEIAKRIAYRAHAFGMRVIAYDPYLTSYDFLVDDLHLRLVDLETVCKESHFISIHVPLTRQTTHLMGMQEFTKMRSDAVLINTSRGGVVKETDLYRALELKMIGGAVLDVFEQEPPTSIPELNNLIITPHVAGLTEEAQVRTSDIVSGEILHVLAGGKSMCTVSD